MELLLNIYDDQTGETENKVIPDPDDATIWNTLRQVVEQATEEPDKDVIVGLYPADEAESIAFYILQDEPWKERSAPPGERDEEPPPLPPPVPGEEASSSPALPEWRCHVEYSRAGNDGRKKEFVTEELKLPDVLEILQHYAKGDRGWQERPEWQAKGTVAAVAETATLDGDSGCGIIYLVIVAFFHHLGHCQPWLRRRLSLGRCGAAGLKDDLGGATVGLGIKSLGLKFRRIEFSR